MTNSEQPSVTADAEELRRAVRLVASMTGKSVDFIRVTRDGGMLQLRSRDSENDIRIHVQIGLLDHVGEFDFSYETKPLVKSLVKATGKCVLHDTSLTSNTGIHQTPSRRPGNLFAGASAFDPSVSEYICFDARDFKDSMARAAPSGPEGVEVSSSHYYTTVAKLTFNKFGCMMVAKANTRIASQFIINGNPWTDFTNFDTPRWVRREVLEVLCDAIRKDSSLLVSAGDAYMTFCLTGDMGVTICTPYLSDPSERVDELFTEHERYDWNHIAFDGELFSGVINKAIEKADRGIHGTPVQNVGFARMGANAVCSIFRDYSTVVSCVPMLIPATASGSEPYQFAFSGTSARSIAKATSGHTSVRVFLQHGTNYTTTMLQYGNCLLYHAGVTCISAKLMVEKVQAVPFTPVAKTLGKQKGPTTLGKATKAPTQDFDAMLAALKASITQ